MSFSPKKLRSARSSSATFGVGLAQDFVELALRLLAPVPEILERGDLGVGLVALWRLEQQVVVALGVERRVQINQVHRFSSHVLAQDMQVVAEIQPVHRLPRAPMPRE